MSTGSLEDLLCITKTIKVNNGPRFEPCGTPHLTILLLDNVWLTSLYQKDRTGTIQMIFLLFHNGKVFLVKYYDQRGQMPFLLDQGR